MKAIVVFLLVLIFITVMNKPSWAQVETGEGTITVPEETQTEPADTSTEQSPANNSASTPTTSITTPLKVTSSNLSCVSVGNPDPGLKDSVCRAAASVTQGPGGPRPQAPDPGNDIQSAIQDNFGITMDGFDDLHLEWAWEKLWEVSGTNFDELVRGAVIRPTTISNTQQVGCPPNVSVLLGPFPEETAFKHIFIHELGHVIRNCAGRERAQETAFMNAFHSEGGVSYYAQNASSCTGSDSPSEDYAEMIAFYLNPGTPVASYLRCFPSAQNRFSATDFPLHFEVARNVLGDF